MGRHLEAYQAEEHGGEIVIKGICVGDNELHMCNVVARIGVVPPEGQSSEQRENLLWQLSGLAPGMEKLSDMKKAGITVGETCNTCVNAQCPAKELLRNLG